MPTFTCEECERLYVKFNVFLATWKRHIAQNKEQESLGVGRFELPYETNKLSESVRLQEDLMEHIERCKITNPPKKTHKGNGTYKGPWAFTITCSPKDNLRFGDMIKAVTKVLKQKSCPATKYAWYLENKGTNSEGEMIHPHIHGMYETASGGRIEAKHWKRAWPIWDEDDPIGAGFRGGYHRPVTHEEGYSSYIAEDGGACGTFNLDENEEPTDEV